MNIEQWPVGAGDKNERGSKTSFETLEPQGPSDEHGQGHELGAINAPEAISRLGSTGEPPPATILPDFSGNKEATLDRFLEDDEHRLAETAKDWTESYDQIVEELGPGIRHVHPIDDLQFHSGNCSRRTP